MSNIRIHTNKLKLPIIAIVDNILETKKIDLVVEIIRQRMRGGIYESVDSEN